MQNLYRFAALAVQRNRLALLPVRPSGQHHQVEIHHIILTWLASPFFPLGMPSCSVFDGT